MVRKLLTFTKWCVGVFLCTLFVVFTVNNRTPMALDLFPFPLIMELPKFLYALAFFGMGVLFAALIKAGQASRYKRRIKEQSTRITALENELTGLRSDLHHSGSSLPSIKDAA